jgi:hypothetical protein
MPLRRSLVLLLASFCATCAAPAVAAPRTVCTITINSPDEREAFRRHLKGSDYRIVELVERGNPDWLASACRSGVRCDTLIVSGHFDGGTEFYTDRLDAREYLPVDDLERAACSESCPGLFSELKDVYLFGCNTLNGQPLRSATGEIARSLQRAGYGSDDVQRVVDRLNERYGQSNRDRLRHIFKDVPVLYGFSSKAPLGRTAGPLLDRYFDATPVPEIASGRASRALLALFGPASMVAVAGVTPDDPYAGFRDDVCRIVDSRPAAAQKLAFVHEVLARDAPEARLFLDYLERFVASLAPGDRTSPPAAAELEAIAHDTAARDRYLALARDADEPAILLRMMALARRLGWLTQDEERDEFVRMLAERMRRNAVGSAEVDLACSRGDRLAALPAALPGAAHKDNVAHAAVLACLGSAPDRAAVVRALASPREDDVTIAGVYLRHRPLEDASEVHRVAASVAHMAPSAAQALALITLAPLRLSDPDVLEDLARLFPRAKTVNEQRAIASVLIRADYPPSARADLAQSLRRHRLKSPEGDDVIDALIRRLAM